MMSVSHLKLLSSTTSGTTPRHECATSHRDLAAVRDERAHSPRALAIVLSIAMGVASASAFADGSQASVKINAELSASIAVPAGWSQALAQVPAGAPPTLRLATPDDGVILLTTYLPLPPKERTDLEQFVKDMNAQSAAVSVEKGCDPEALSGAHGRGAYCEFTDANLVGATLKPGQYRQVASGIFESGKAWVNFSLLANDRTAAEYRAALDAVGTIEVRSSHP